MSVSFFSKLFGKKNLKHEDYSVLAVDLHSHLIPGVDDGVAGMDEAIMGIEKINALGFDKIITTPHIMPGYYDNTSEVLLKGCREVKAELEKRDLKIDFSVAAEYFCDEDFHKKVEEEDLLSFGNNYVLFELPFFNKPGNLKEAVFAMQSKGYKPVLAHIERYGYFLDKKMDDFAEMRDNGLFIQVNLTSFAGAYGLAVKKLAENLAKSGQIDFLATDYHHTKHLPVLNKALENEHLQLLLDSNSLKNKELL